MARRRHAWLLLVAAAWSGGAAAAQVVVHPAFADDAINRSVLRGIFGMRVRAWADGQPVRVFVLEDEHPVHEEFVKSELQMYPYQLRLNWDRLLYSGTGQQPVTVDSEQEMLRRVAETPGAIGYLRHYVAPAPRARRAGTAEPLPLRVKVLNVR